MRNQNPNALLTRRQLKRQADALLKNSLQGPRQSIIRSQEEARKQAQQDAEMIQGFTTALAGIIAAHPGGQEYAPSADRQQRIAQGYALGQHLAEQGTTDQGNALLASQGQTRRLATGQGSTVTYARGGAAPAAFLNTAGDAAAAAARNLPDYTGGRGQQLVAGRLAQGADEQAKLRAQLDDLMAKVPGLRADIMDRLYQRELAKQAAATQASYLGVSQYNAATQRQSNIDPSTGLPWSVETGANKNQNAQATKARQARLTALSSNRDKAFSYADKLYNRKDPTGTVSAAPTWEQAYGQIWARYGQPVMRYAPPGNRKWWKGQIDAYIFNALKTAGFTKARGTNRG